MAITTLPDIYNANLNDVKAQIELAVESNRKDTFKSWIFSEDKRCSASKLAEAGFYYIGSKHEPDAVQCFLCGKPLDGWEEEDDPWLEHKKHSPECKFVKLGKPECRLTVNEFIDIQLEIPRLWIKKMYENKKMELQISRQKILKNLPRS